jgi:rod shape determining protein RodA
MFVAGVHWAYFAAVISPGVSGGCGDSVPVARHIVAVAEGLPVPPDRHVSGPGTDPLNAGYHITQAKIALGSGGWTGRGFMQGTQSRLNFLPEKHTDFIFTTLAEEFGFIGGCVVAGALCADHRVLRGGGAAEQGPLLVIADAGHRG